MLYLDGSTKFTTSAIAEPPVIELTGYQPKRTIRSPYWESFPVWTKIIQPFKFITDPKIADLNWKVGKETFQSMMETQFLWVISL